MSDLLLKDIPIDIRNIILTQQKEEKINRGTNQYSLSSVIFKIIREWKNNCRPGK